MPSYPSLHPDYEIIRELGRGGMGVVYLAYNQLMGRVEVLKAQDKGIVEQSAMQDRFLREIRAVARLRHSDIVAAYSAYRSGENLVLAMEYVEGLDLARMVRAKGSMPVGHACYFVSQAALALQHAHEEGLVHRDIKPGNQMLSHAKGRALIKVLDFGLAKATREIQALDYRGTVTNRAGPSDGQITLDGQILGTPEFIAPEQISDSQNADIRADIYSLGCTLYYLLIGHAPFPKRSLMGVIQAHRTETAAPLDVAGPDVPAELAAVVAMLMEKQPDRRFQTPAVVARALTPFFKKGDEAPTLVADTEINRRRPGDLGYGDQVRRYPARSNGLPYRRKPGPPSSRRIQRQGRWRCRNRRHLPGGWNDCVRRPDGTETRRNGTDERAGRPR